MIPEKLHSGDPFARLMSLWNMLIDHLRETALFPGPGIRLRRTASGTVIESERAVRCSPGAPGGEDDYAGYFTVVVKTPEAGQPETQIMVIDGADPGASVAGVTDIGDVAAATIDAQNGTLSLYAEYVVSDYSTGAGSCRQYLAFAPDDNSWTKVRTIIATVTVADGKITVDQRWTDNTIYWASRYIL